MANENVASDAEELAEGEYPEGTDPGREEAGSSEWVRWTGGSPNHASERVLSVADWRKAQIENPDDDKTVVWNDANGRVVNRDVLDFLTDEEFERFIVRDAGFQIVDDESLPGVVEP